MTTRITGLDPTGSSFDRIDMCAASAALPQVFDGHANEDRGRGTALHYFLDRVAKLRVAGETPEAAREQALAEVDDQWRVAAELVDLEQLGHRTTLSTEVAVAYDWRADKGRVLQLAGPRQYEIDPDREVALTLDLVGVGDRVVHVGDYKGPWAWLPAPERSLQLGVGALALARIYRARSAHVEYLRLRSDGSVSAWRAQLDVFGLDAVAQRVHTMMTGVEQLAGAIAAGVVPNVTEGPWCTYCKARQHCPAKTQLVRAVLAGDAKQKLSLREPITAENVATVYSLLRKTKEAVSHVEKAIRAYEADGEPSTPERLSPSAIPIGTDADGSRRFFGRFERAGGEKIDGGIAHAVLVERFGPEVATKAFELSTSKEAIRDVIRQNKAEGETITAVETEVLTKIRQLGGSKHPPTDKPTEFTVAPDGSAKKASRKAG